MNRKERRLIEIDARLSYLLMSAKYSMTLEEVIKEVEELRSERKQLEADTDK